MSGKRLQQDDDTSNTSEDISDFSTFQNTEEVLVTTVPTKFTDHEHNTIFTPATGKTIEEKVEHDVPQKAINSEAERVTVSPSSLSVSQPGAFHVGGLPTEIEQESSVSRSANYNPVVFDSLDMTAVTAQVVDDDAEQDRQRLREELQRMHSEQQSAPKAELIGQDENQPSTSTCSLDIVRGRKEAKISMAVSIVVVLAVIAMIVCVTIVTTMIDDITNEEGNVRSTELLQPTLKTIKERGFIRCRAETSERNRGHGLSLDLCQALAAAIFGDPNKTEYPLVPWRELWLSLSDGTVDVSTSMSTVTMARDVYEEFSRIPQSFSTPWFFTGTQIAGDPELVDCADRGDTFTGRCKDLVVCSVEGSMINEYIKKHLDGAGVVLVQYSADMFTELAKGTCNVVCGEPVLIYEQRARDAGYTGLYEFGSKVHSLEPLALASRGDDPQLADFVNAVLQALFTAEMEGITNATASTFPQTDLFGDGYEDMFRNAIAAVGNWGQVYERNYEQRVARSGFNLLYGKQGEANSTGGLLYAPPFSNLDFNPIWQDDILPSRVCNGTLETVSTRGHLRCGILPDRPGFAELSANGTWVGMDIDLCRCLSISLFADPDQVLFVPVEDSTSGFSALAGDLIDVFAGATYSLEADIQESNSCKGYAFSPTYFYGEDGSMLALATNDNATQWADFVQWTIYSLIYAEENSIGRDDASQMPTVDLFGPDYELMFRLAVYNQGNYGELYERNLEALIPRAGPNLLNNGQTPLINPLPIDMFRGRMT